MSTPCEAKDAALILARRQERKTDKRHYVVHTHTGEWLVVDALPFLGEWYDADGIRHGDNN